MLLIDDLNLVSESFSVNGVYNAENRNPPVSAVYLDGERVPHCIHADENRGFVISHKTDVTGKILHTDGMIISEIKFGKVEVVLDGVE